MLLATSRSRWSGAARTGTGRDAGPADDEAPVVGRRRTPSRPRRRRGLHDARSRRAVGPTATASAGSVGIVGASCAGIVSALLGVGGGIVKVPVMHLVMGVPLRVATATSNLMIGITRTASAIIYLLRGGIDPYVAGPTAVGVFVGASIGSRIAPRVDVRVLRWLFVVVLLYTAFEMARRALGIA